MNLGTYSESATEFEVIPAGIYDVRLDNIEIKPKNPAFIEDGKDDKQFEWLWSINDGPQAGKTFKAWTNRTINKGSTAKPWVEALLNRPLRDGETLNSDDILEKTMKVYLSEHTTEKGKVVNRIKDVLSGPKPENDLEDAVTPEKGYARRFSEAAQKLTNANQWTRDQTRAYIAKQFPGYKEFGKLHPDAQGPILQWIEAEVKNAPDEIEVEF